MSDTASKERQALTDMLSLPEVRRIEVARLQPGDVLVLECDAHITPDMAERLNEYMKEVFPEQKCMVLERGLSLKIAVRGVEVEA